ncbi:MAG: thiamine biosynthesis protein ThiS [Bacteroidetes bacterium RIFCSPLOWO2_12_FULL_31_6]|nr:MAG: thiamine biosynthesis protein ThiS [Bacteroidetes bacterium RIFCSPLOWO2_12_FULL_31_6]
MTIYINNEAQKIKAEKFLNEVLDGILQNIAFGTAIAVNNKVISKNDWGNYSLKEDDKILIIKASQGG